MAHDFEDFSSIEDLDDGELRQLVRDRLAENPDLDVDDIRVEVSNGTIRLEGRVGTESELRIAEHVVTDVIGATDVENALIVDEIRRFESPEDAEDHVVAESASAGTLYGEMPPQESDEAFEARGDENLQERMYGTTNMQDAIAHGTAYEPPDTPTAEGIGGAGSDENQGEAH
jgi:hypothetical protein